METNLYQAPKSDLQVANSIDYDRIFKIASRQRALLVAILCQLFLNPVIQGIGTQGKAAALVALLIFLGLLVFIVVTAIRLSHLLNHVVVTVILGIFSVFPLINLIALLILSRQSTNALKRAGIRVGLLGASPKDIPRI